MLKSIKINLDAIEAMNYFWHAASDKDHIEESFFFNLVEMPAMQYLYEDEFGAEQVRLVLSAIKNRELVNGNKKVKKFWNYNMWVMEDLEYTRSMISPCKKLNLDDIVEELKEKDTKNNIESLEVIFTIMYDGVYEIRDNKLLINFFRVKPGDFDNKTYINGIEMKEFIKDKLIEVLNQ